MFARYAQHYDLFNKNKSYKKEIELIYKWAGKPKSIFDVGAGTGNYWKYYPKGTDIIGIDKSLMMVCQARDEKKYIIHADATKYMHRQKEKFDCATALFNVINYISKHKWWKNIPLKTGGFFIFDIWMKEKVDIRGFRDTVKTVGEFTRVIKPIKYDGKTVVLRIEIFKDKKICSEKHKMYIYSHKDIQKFCGKEFIIIEKKPTFGWQTWYRLKRKKPAQGEIG